jgi:hypothetical protein
MTLSALKSRVLKFGRVRFGQTGPLPPTRPRAAFDPSSMVFFRVGSPRSMGDGLLFGRPYPYVDDTVFADEKSLGTSVCPVRRSFGSASVLVQATCYAWIY